LTNDSHKDHFSNVKIPAIHRAGWWDIFQQGNINTFIGASTMGSINARAQQYLFVEPLGHCEGSANSFGYPNYVINDWFPLSVALFQNDTSAAVFKRIDKLNLYVMGPVPNFLPRNSNWTGNYWSSIAAWPKTTPSNYYLAANGLLSSTPPSQAGSGKYAYNPKNPVTSYGGNNLLVDPCGPQDQSKEVEARADVLKFTANATLTQPLAICGHVTATIFVASDQVDTDFTVALTDVYPDNQSVLVRYGIVRMRWRNNASQISLMTPNQVYNVTIDLWSTCHIFNVGHKIRATVTSSNSPQFTVNPNNGHLLVDPDQPMNVANNIVYFGGSTASYVTLPVVDINDLPVNKNIQ